MSSLRLLKDLVITKHGTTKLFVLYPKQKLDSAFEYMFNSGVHHLPVVEEGSDKADSTLEYVNSGNLLGIITDRDLRLAVESPLLLVGQNDEKRKTFEESFDDMMSKLREHTVDQVMAKSVITVDDDATIIEAAKLMRVADVGAVPVLRKGTKELIGICTRSDLIDHLIRIMEPIEEAK